MPCISDMRRRGSDLGMWRARVLFDADLVHERVPGADGGSAGTQMFDMLEIEGDPERDRLSANRPDVLVEGSRPRNYFLTQVRAVDVEATPPEAVQHVPCSGCSGLYADHSR